MTGETGETTATVVKTGWAVTGGCTLATLALSGARMALETWSGEEEP